ncbi:nucleoside kinase [Alkalitalea saponilacus]|uniref:Uridine kinase n=1 Tax=Alkalitalea saponilacus TaxID=889453 RepID=A0A1T5HLM1_9BACT|nr:nucleoside kinase [Alkalitalea saponilacus]ASB47811.1 AAA family ATPase [Alkalitalea saponilacus]SKC21461.1 uridine kinase [Alkalitalea saponilacus]
MNKKEIKIKCLNNDKVIVVPRGTTLLEAAEKLDVNLSNPILGAMVNNRLRNAGYEFFQPKTVRFIDVTHVDGMRMYIRSLSFVLYAAVQEMLPGARLRIEHSVSKGFYCELDNLERELTVQMTIDLAEKMREIVAKDIPIEKYKEETDEVIKLFDAHSLCDKIDLIKHRGQNYTSYYKMGKHIGVFYGFMVPSTGYLPVFDLNKYYNGMLLRLPKASKPDTVEDLIIQNKLFEIFREFSQWNKILNVTKISDLNKAAGNGKSETLIKVTEALHEKKISQIADRIAARKNKIKIVLISGPSSSGKTTFGKRLAVQLLVAGIKPLNLSLDNYFVNRDNTPLDENGDFDFEALEAIDLKLFNEHLVALLDGKEVEIPRFSFETGERFYNGEKLKMGSENILIIEGIHGLNPALTPSVADEAKYKVYVSALTGINIDDHTRIPTTDNRLIRRIVRDYKYRKYSAQDTISRWASVRRGEEKHIFPYQEEADVMFNTALLYEFAVLKPFAEPILLEVQPNQPEYSEATRLLKFFSYFKPMQPNGIPPTSILREFLGGSSFTY